MNGARKDIKPNPGEVTRPHDVSLTQLETEIIALVEDGYTDKEIAKELTLSRQAVENHLIGIFEKLGVANRLELVLFSIDLHLTEMPPAKARPCPSRRQY
jgi:DNA-binding NarL/FixJ family response regulator